MGKVTIPNDALFNLCKLAKRPKNALISLCFDVKLYILSFLSKADKIDFMYKCCLRDDRYLMSKLLLEIDPQMINAMEEEDEESDLVVCRRNIQKKGSTRVIPDIKKKIRFGDSITPHM